MGSDGIQANAAATHARTSTVAVEGATLRYRLDGDATSPVVVLSNSLGTNLAMWDAQVAALAQRFRVVRYDSRGHGGSTVTAGPYGIGQLAQDVLALLDALHIERCHFCGLSMGGMVGMWLGSHAGARIDRMVLCNTAPRIGTAESWNARIDKVRKEGMEAIADAVLEGWFTPGYRERYAGVMLQMRAMLVAISVDGYAASCAAVRDMDQWHTLPGIRRPTLVISGTHDVATPPADGRRMAEEIAGARYAELDAAHISNVEAADRFTAAVVQFLDH